MQMRIPFQGLNLCAILKTLGTKKIVITGAPGTGKTSIIKSLEALQFHCYHEIIRDMTAEAKNNETLQEKVSNPLVFVNDPMAFNLSLLEGRKAHFDHSEGIGTSLCFFDRGMPDVLAYMDYFNQQYPQEFETACFEKKYDVVFILPPWKDIYVSDNERLESFQEAEGLHGHLSNTYKRFGYKPVFVPKTSVENRTQFILNTINA